MCLVLSLYFVFHSRTSFESSDLAINFIKGLYMIHVMNCVSRPVVVKDVFPEHLNFNFSVRVK